MEITANASQAIESNDNVLFQNVVIPGNCSIIYQAGSGLVTIKGLCCGQNRARFRVRFSGNLKADTSETVSGITLLYLAIAQNGEKIPYSTMTVTVADTTSTYNVGTEVLIDVPAGCCKTISVKNVTPNLMTVDVINANLIIERVA